RLPAGARRPLDPAPRRRRPPGRRRPRPRPGHRRGRTAPDRGLAHRRRGVLSRLTGRWAWPCRRLGVRGIASAPSRGAGPVPRRDRRAAMTLTSLGFLIVLAAVAAVWVAATMLLWNRWPRLLRAPLRLLSLLLVMLMAVVVAADEANRM